MNRPMTALVIALALAALGCQGEPPAPAPAAPPGQEEDPVAAAQALEAAGQRVAAYQAWARLAQTLPESDPRSAQARAQAERLGFLLGVGEGERGSISAPAPEVAPERQGAIDEATTLYKQAVALQEGGDQQKALETYRKVLTLVDSKEAPDLYWNAFQRANDLQPAPPAAPGSGEGDEGDEGDRPDEPEGREEEGGAIPGTPDAGRDAYMRGLSLEQSGHWLQARDAFRIAVRTLKKDEDPQLTRAAQQHLELAERKVEELNPSMAQ